MRRTPGLRLAFWLSFLIFGANAIATHSSESEVDGKMLLQKYCNLPRSYTIGDAIYDAMATYDATTRHGTSASLFTASFH